jgi:hypothetical protein
MSFSRLPLLWRVFAINATLLAVATRALAVKRSHGGGVEIRFEVPAGGR